MSSAVWRVHVGQTRGVVKGRGVVGQVVAGIQLLMKRQGCLEEVEWYSREVVWGNYKTRQWQQLR